MSKPTDARPIALTPGEPAGVGPEIVLALARQGLPCPIVAVADPRMLAERARKTGLGDLRLPLYDGGPVDPAPGTLPVLPVKVQAPARCGELDPRNAPYVLETLTRAAEGCAQGHFAALVTGPVHKGVINEAGMAFTGHTEFLARLAGAEQVVMMLAVPGLRVALATTHLPLVEVARAITRERLGRVLQVLHGELQRRFGLSRPRVLVCGLNPHAGEGGHLGHEETEVITPLLDELRGRGWDLVGPLPADTAFTPPSLSDADAVLAMYHDQGLPVLKHMGFGRAVNITLGLPYVRTSVDHGTALELAGTGKASAHSLRAALDMASVLVRSVKP